MLQISMQILEMKILARLLCIQWICWNKRLCSDCVFWCLIGKLTMQFKVQVWSTDNNMTHTAARRSTDLSFSELQTSLSSRLLRRELKDRWLLCSLLYEVHISSTSYSGNWLSEVSEKLVINFRMVSTRPCGLNFIKW